MAQRDEINAAFSSPIFTDAVGATPPDEASRKLNLQNKTGIPAGLIQPAHEQMDQRAQIQAAFDGMATRAPKTAEWGSKSPYHAALVKDSAEQSEKLESSFFGKVQDAATGAWVAAGSMLPRVAGGLVGAERMFADLFITPWARAGQRALGVSDYDIAAPLVPAQQKYAKLTEELGGVATEKLVEGGVPESIAPGVTSGFQMVGQIAQVLAAPATVLPTMGLTTTGEAYGQAREKGLDPLKAAYFATGQGAIEVGTEAFAMSGLLKAAKNGSPLAKAAVGMLAKEIPGEQIATAGQDLLEVAMLTPEKTLGEYLEERPNAALQTLVATLVGGGGMISVAAAADGLNRAVLRNAKALVEADTAQAPERQRAEAAAQAFASLTQAAEATQAHSLRKHSKELFREYIGNLTEGSGLETLHVDAAALSEVLSQQHPDVVNALFAAVPELSESIQLASATQGTVAISAADLLTHFDAPALQKEMLNLVRATPEGMTYSESQAFFQSQSQELEQQAQQLAEEADPVLPREEYEAAQQAQATPDELAQRTAERLTELAALPEERITPEQQQEMAALTTADAQAQAQHFGVELVAEKPAYSQYLKTRGDKAAVRAAEVENLRRSVIEGMRAMNVYTESAIQAYATPFTEFYQVNSAKMGMLPSELMAEVPLSFMAEKMSGVNPQANNKATAEDFTAGGIANILQKSDWAIMTAENPMRRELSAEENAARNAALRSDLEAAGYNVVPVTGVYDRPDESSFIVLGVTAEDALAIGQKYEQDSVITREGFIYHDGMYTEAKGVTQHDTRPEQYFTTLPDGSMFTIEMEMDADFNFVKKPRGPRDPGDAILESNVLSQTVQRIADNEAPEGPLSTQDTKDLRRLWEMYTVADGETTRYGAPTPEAAKAADVRSAADALSAMQRIFDAVYEGSDAAPELKDVSSIFEGERFPKDQGYAIAFSKTVTVDGKSKSRTGEIYVDLSDKTIQINVSQWGEGGRGAALYKSVFEFARANGFKFIGDTAGISVAGIKRRLENMLSHAIQTNDVRYMALHPKQVAFIEKETGVKIQWLANDAEKTIEQMLNASYNLAIKDTPEVRYVYFDFTRNLFVDSRTGRTAAGVAGLVTPPSGDADILARKGKAGSATLARTALAVSVLRARSPEDRHMVLRAAAQFSLAGLPGAERLLYQKTGGSAREGAVSVVGHHFSTQRRALLDGRFYGTGASGAERRRVMDSDDLRLRNRVHFYVDEGKGVFPEVGVGREEHVIQLHNMYDGARNPLRIPASDSNAFEAAVLDAGFDGYYIEAGFGRQGVAVLLGDASRGVVTEEGFKQVAAAANNAAAEKLDELVAKYLERNTQQGTAIVDTDAARELFPDYAASSAARTRFSAAVHEASSKVSGEVYRRVLADEPAEGKLPLVVFTAGGGGSGKSSARALFGAQYEQAQIIYDSTMSKYDTAKKRIEEALAAGKDVHINYVSRDPLTAWVAGVLPRAMQDGRIVPLYAHAQAHRNAAVVLRKLAAEYEGHPRVSVTVVENHGAPKDIKRGTLDSLASVNYNDLEARLYEALDEEFKNGKISRQVYEAAKAHSRGVQESDAGAAQGVVGGAGTGGYFQSEAVDRPITKPAFYSVLTQQVEKHQQKKGSPQQWAEVIGVMAKKGIVKAEEVEYTGVLDWLEGLKESKPSAKLYDAEGKLVGTSSNTEARPPEGGRTVVVDFSKSIPREDVVDYLRNNAVVVNPVVRSGAGEDAAADISIGQGETEEPDESYMRELAEELFEQGKDELRAEYAERNDLELDEVDDEDIISELVDQEVTDYWSDSESPQFANVDVTLPSGEELTLQAEYAYGENRLYDTNRNEYGDIGNVRYIDEAVIESYLRKQYPEEFGTGEGTKWGEYTLGGDKSDYQERLLVNESHEGEAFEYDTHFDEENITAFTRSDTRYVPLETLGMTHPELADRLRAEGKTQAKVLFAEEIQSDWAQQGRDTKKVYEQVPYTLEMLSQLEENKAAHEARARMEAVLVSHEGPDWYSVVIKENGQQVAPPQFESKEEAEAWADRLVSAQYWKVQAADGQIFQLPRRNHQNIDSAMQYIVNTKAFSRVKEEYNAFELDAKREALKKEIDAVLAQRRSVVLNEEGDAVFNAITKKAEALEYELEALPSGIAPAAFVTKTDSWVALAVKDLIRHAAENDFDLVSWTTGDQQTARWSGGLRKRVDTIEWVKSSEGVIHIKAMRGNSTVGDTRYSDNDLTAAIGKTMAERIINDPSPSGKIEGDDIVVADLGMVKFYGNADGNDPSGNPAIVTKVTNQVLKKLGADVKVRSVDVYPKWGLLRDRAKEEHPHFQPSFEVTPQLKEMAMQGLPLFQDKKLAYFDPEQMMIAMLKGANLSSMIHESGHFYLEALAKMSSHPKATQQMKDDFAKALKWFGIPDRASWDALTLEQKRPFHEQWAQSFERWTMEGRAPTAEMQPVFARFRAWMLSVYKSLEQFLQKNPLAGRLNDEVRGVFSRLLAAEDAIKAAEEARGFIALTKPEGVSEEDYAKYLELGESATQDAISDMQTRTLRDMKWLSNAKHKAIRKLQREAAAKRRAIREEVTKEVMAEPVNQARTFLTKGEVNDANGDAVQVAVGHKLDTAALREMYPVTALARPDLTKLRGMTGKGVHPDVIAGVFGFSSGDALVRELIEAESAKDKIDGLTDQRMLERHGELIDAESVERAAEAAIHNEARAKFLATGLTMLTKSPAPARELAKAAKEAAANVIARKKVRDLRPKQFSAAEARANKKALELAPKSPAEAADAQRAALLNNRLAAAATEALDDVEKALRLAEKFKSDGVRKNLDLEYLEQIDDLLNGFDFRKGQSLKAIDKRRSFAEFVALQEERGFEPIVTADQMEAMSRKHYKDMTVEELRGLVDAVKHLEHLARLKKKLLTAKDEREFAQRIAEAVQSIEANANRTVEERATPSDVLGRAAQLWRGFAAEHRKVASIVREMDGSQDGGVMWDLLIRPMNEAGDNETEMRAQAAEKMGELFAPIKHKMGGIKGHLKVQRTVVPGTKLSMSYEERVMFALNWGNEGNRQRLLDGGLTGKRSLTEDEARAIIGTLDKQDWEFVQSTWDYFETFRPAVAEMERELTGKEPQWVEASPVETKFGVYRGGYFPAKYDAELSTRSESLEAAATLRMGMKGAFGNAGTRNGYTQKRAEQVVDRPILLSFNVISQHVSEVTHRVSWQRWVVDANRVLRALDGTVRDYYGPEILREMKKLVEDVAAGDAPAANVVERVINHLRVGSTIVGMGWRVTTAMLQPSGLAQSWVRIGGKWTAMGVKQYLANPIASAESVESRSKLMRDRNRTMQREINEILNTVRVGDSVSNVQASYFWLIAKMQRTVDVPTWLGAYEKAVAQLGLENAADDKAREAIEEKAVAMADQAVLDAQSGGQIKDLARVQRGSPIYKMFTNFYSYFSATYNLNVEAYRRTNFKEPAEVGAFAVDMLILNTLPVLFSVALKELLKGGCDNDDVACLLKQVGQEQTNYLFGQMILLREAGAAAGALTGDSFGYTGPAGLRFFSDLYKAGQQVGQGEADFAAWKAVTNTLAVPLHLPMGQVNATLEGIVEMEKGNVEGFGILPALIAGKERKE